MSDTLPDGCGYQGFEFGAAYLDSQCFGGKLYDMDNCEDGMIFEPNQYIPCPECNHSEWLGMILENCEDKGATDKQEGLPRQSPYIQSHLKYPDDFEAMRSAYFKGWDEYNPTTESPGGDDG